MRSRISVFHPSSLSSRCLRITDSTLAHLDAVRARTGASASRSLFSFSTRRLAVRAAALAAHFICRS